MTVETSVGQRFLQLIQQLGMSKNAFAMSLDKTATVIQHLVDERNKPGFDLMNKVIDVYPNVSTEWLLRGKGPMLLNDAIVPVVAEAAPAAPTAPAKPLDAPTTPGFPAPLFAVSTARPSAPTVSAPLPAEVEPLAAPLAAVPQVVPAVNVQPTPGEAQAVSQPEAIPAPPSPTPTPVAAPVAPDATYLTAALHAQHLQHQLALAEQRNQHLLEQQALMQQMLELMRQSR